ncbi:MAG: SIS domain-containing protein, partial [Bacteroidota bacterium]
MNPYIADILAQPQALREGVSGYPSRAVRDLRNWLLKGDFDRILITGMGSSYNAAYPAVIQLAGQAVPVELVNTAELLHARRGMIRPRSLLWMNSQSGESAEVVRLLEQIRHLRPACSLAFVNAASSSLALEADVTVPIHAGPEATVSTKTYVNMLAANLLAASDLMGGDSEALAGELMAAAGVMEQYLAAWEDRAEEIDQLLVNFE